MARKNDLASLVSALSTETVQPPAPVPQPPPQEEAQEIPAPVSRSIDRPRAAADMDSVEPRKRGRKPGMTERTQAVSAIMPVSVVRVLDQARLQAAVDVGAKPLSLSRLLTEIARSVSRDSEERRMERIRRLTREAAGIEE